MKIRNLNGSSNINLKFERKTLILSHFHSKTIQIQDCLIFPHHLDGLKVWEAGIVLARYVFLNSDLFDNKVILDLGTGTGLASITALKFTHAKRVYLTDYQPEILENALISLKLNSRKHVHNYPSPSEEINYCSTCGDARAVLQRFDWREQKETRFKADIIIGSDIIYTGGFLAELHSVMKNQLKDEGKAFIIIPSFRQAKAEFLKIVKNEGVFDYEVEELNEEKYLESPFSEATEGFRMYKGLKELKFSMYIFTKRRKNSDDAL